MSCSENCAACDENSCHYCETGYALIEGVCIMCSPNCVYCDSETNCMACATGYALENGMCT